MRFLRRARLPLRVLSKQRGFGDAPANGSAGIAGLVRCVADDCVGRERRFQDVHGRRRRPCTTPEVFDAVLTAEHGQADAGRCGHDGVVHAVDIPRDPAEEHQLNARLESAGVDDMPFGARQGAEVAVDGNDVIVLLGVRRVHCRAVECVATVPTCELGRCVPFVPRAAVPATERVDAVLGGGAGASFLNE